jgi:uncharacterized protein YjbJ (UPF0337 family)
MDGIMNMNEDILKGKWQEISGRVKEIFGKLTDNDLDEIEGKREKLFGRLQKKYGWIKDKADLEYKDSVELAEIVSSIRKMMNINNDIMAISCIARYGQPLFAKKQETQTTEKETKNGNDTDRYFDSRFGRRNPHLAPQQELGILSQRGAWIGSADCTHPSADGSDLKFSVLDRNQQDD